MSVSQVQTQSHSPKRKAEGEADQTKKSPGKIHRAESFSPDRRPAMSEIQSAAAPAFELPSALSRAPQVPVLPSASAFQTPPTLAKRAPSGVDSDLEDFSLKASVETDQTHSPAPAKAQIPSAFQKPKGPPSALLSLSPGQTKMGPVQSAALAAHSHSGSLSMPLAADRPAVAADPMAFDPLSPYNPTKAPPPSPRREKPPVYKYRPSVSALSLSSSAKVNIGPVQSAAFPAHSHSHSHSGSMSMSMSHAASAPAAAAPMQRGLSAKPINVKPDDASSVRNKGKGKFKPVKLLDDDSPRPLRNSPPPPTPKPTVAKRLDAFDDVHKDWDKKWGMTHSAARLDPRLVPSTEMVNPYAKTAQCAGSINHSVKLQGEDIPVQALTNTWGTYSQLFLEVEDETSLLKVLHSKHYNQGVKYCDSLYDTIIAQHDALRARGLKVVQITNRDTVKQDGCLRMRYIEQAFVPEKLFKGAINEKENANALLDQYINFLMVALEGTPNTQIDMDPSNYRVDALDGKLILVDFREAIISPQSLVFNLVQNLTILFQGNLEVTGRIRDAISKKGTPLARALLQHPSFIKICPMEDL